MTGLLTRLRREVDFVEKPRGHATGKDQSEWTTDSEPLQGVEVDESCKVIYTCIEDCSDKLAFWQEKFRPVPQMSLWRLQTLASRSI